MKKFAICLMILMFAASCSSDSGDTGPNGPNGSDCQGAKCDGTNLPVLTAIPSEFGMCTVAPDLENEVALSTDTWDCEFFGFEPDVPADLDSLSLWYRNASGSQGSFIEFSSEDVAESSRKSAGTWRGTTYPIETWVSPKIHFVTSNNGRLGAGKSDSRFVTAKLLQTVDSRPEQDLDQAWGLDAELWQVVIWPTAELAEAFNNGDIDNFSAEVTGDVVFDTDLIAFRYGRNGFGGFDDLTDLPAQTFVVPAQPERALPTLEVKYDSYEVTHSGEVDGPGYYLIEADGSLQKADPAEVLERGMRRDVRD